MARALKKKITIEFRKQDEWVYDELHNIIKMKKELGVNVTLNFEVVRLIKKGLVA